MTYPEEQGWSGKFLSSIINTLVKVYYFTFLVTISDEYSGIYNGYGKQLIGREGCSKENFSSEDQRPGLYIGKHVLTRR